VYPQVHRLFCCFASAHNRGRAANFTNTTFAKPELAVNTLRKAKFVNASLPNTRFVQITKFSEDLF
jgi:hypothetical protein